jgi:hypothetical protein
MSPLTAARVQMELSLGFHMIFAALGIGMPLLMVLAEHRYLKTGDAHWKQGARSLRCCSSSAPCPAPRSRSSSASCGRDSWRSRGR